MKYDRGAAHAATEPESQQYKRRLQLRARTLYLTGRREGMGMARSLFPIRLGVSGFQIAVLPLDKLLHAEARQRDKKRCTECGTSFVSKIEQRQILPGLPEADYPQTGSGAHEKTARGGYAIRAKPDLQGINDETGIYDTEYLFLAEMGCSTA